MKFNYLKFALCAPSIRVGAPMENAEQIISSVKKAYAKGAEIAAFGNLSLSGSTLGSMIKYNQLLKGCEQALIKIVDFSKTCPVAIIIGLPVVASGRIVSAAAVIHGGEIKCLACTCSSQAGTVIIKGVEYKLENRILISDTNSGAKMAVVFGEDFDNVYPKSAKYSACGADIIINLASSPALINSFEGRKEKIRLISERLSCGYIYVSTGLGESVAKNVFSGDKICAECGENISSCDGDKDDIIFAEIDTDAIRADKLLKEKTFETCDNIVHLNIKSSDCLPTREIDRLPFVPDDAEFDRIFDIMARGIYTRMQVSGNESVILGLSGGLDSTLVLLACVKAFEKYNLDKNNIIAITMSGFGSSSRTKNNAKKLVKLLGVRHLDIPILDAVTNHLKAIGHSGEKDVVYENSQARERTKILLDLANKLKGLMLGTGDLSEIALGWSTYGGDQLAQYNPNSSLTKTLIRAMTRNYCLMTKNTELAKTLNDILSTPVSPELTPNQDTEKILGSYELHDFFLYNLIGRGFSIEKTANMAFNAFFEFSKKDILNVMRTFVTRFFKNQFKRSAGCDGIQMTEFDLTDKIIYSEFEDEQFLLEIDKLEKQL